MILLGMIIFLAYIYKFSILFVERIKTVGG
jgi:hypothetical protein